MEQNETFIKRGWSVPREWPGETVVVIGGGPSLTRGQIESAKRFRRIAANDAGIVLDPDCDVICWNDVKWFIWNRHELHLHRGKYKICWKSVPETRGLQIYVLAEKPKGSKLAWSQDPKLIACSNSGQGAINLATHFGATRILLIGFDMRPIGDKNNFHTRHQQKVPGLRMRAFIPDFIAMAPLLAAAGIQVINCTPNSQLRCFEQADIRDVS